MKTFSRHWYRVLMLVALFATFCPVGATATAQEPPPKPAAAEEASRKSADAATPPSPVASSELPARKTGAVQIRLQQATFDPLQTSPQLLSTLSQIAYAGDGTGYYLVQFEGPILPEWKETLAKEGVSLHDYVPDFAFIVKMDRATANRVQTLEMVRWVGLYQPAYRLSNTLLPTVQSPQAGQLTKLVMRSFTGEPAEGLVKALAGLGATILSQSRDTGGGTIFQVELPETEVVNVARLSGIAWVQPKYTPVLYNAVARSSASMNKDAVENTLGLYGEGQIVVVGDTGFSTGNAATMHQDFRGHFYKGSWGSGSCGTWADPDSHGTHVAGSVLGSGVMDGAVTTTHSYAGTNAGIAPEALLWGWAFCVNNSWDGLPDAPYDDYYGVMYNDDPRVRVNTNSWGSNAPHGTYDTFSRDTDRFIWDHPDMVVLVAAGNDGTDGNSDGIVDVDSMGIPAGSKNIITVGASENYRLTGGYNPGGDCQTWNDCWGSDYPANPVRDDRLSDDPSGMVAFSSRGPVDDGRLKPDVVAPGSNIVSTRDDSGTGWGIYDANYIYMGGTSMATPLTAGAAAIVREFYSDTYSLNPTAALVKATFINGAFDMTPGQYRDEVPGGSQDDVVRRADINQGWGRVDLATSLIYTAPRQLWFHEHTTGLATNGEYSATFNVRYAENPFRVSLVWSDQAGTEASHGALVNDLDLIVESSTGSTYYGNDIVGDGLLDGDVDRTNNVEGVDLAPGVGTYTVIVKGYNVTSGPQPFALVVSGDTGSAGALGGVVSDAETSVGIANAQVAAAIAPTGDFNFATTAGDGTYLRTLVAGTYTVTASAYGYAPQTVTGVAIADGVTTTQDFSLSPAPSYLLTGTVTDASTGWALYASVEIAPDGYPATTVWTNPWTGVYSATLAGNYTHTLTVAPWSGIPGYVSQSRQVTLSANRTNENFALAADAAACTAPGYTKTGSSEGFEVIFPPTGWNVYETGDTSGPGWQQGATGATGSTGDPHSGTYYAWHNDDNLTTAAIDWLVLPQFAVPAGGASLTFWQRDNYQTYYDYHGVWVTTGASPDPSVSTYVELWTEDTGSSWVQQTVDLSAYAGQNIYLAFRYEGDFMDEWYIDDVSLLGPCTVPTGGLIAGSVYDANTNAALTGATVSNQDGYARVTAATPGSPLLSDSFYVLYSPAGSKTFTATMSGYTPAVAYGVPVVAGKTGGQDFFLDAGYIVADPAALSAWLKPDGSTVKSFTLTNDGGEAATFNVIEVGSATTDVVQDGGFEGGTPSAGWDEASTNFGTPICDVASCGSTGGGTGPHTGTYWAWFGGIEGAETGSVGQDVTIPVGSATLSFWLEIPASAAPITMSVYIDGNEVFNVSQAEASQYNPYAQVTVDVTAYADGGSHNLMFHSVEAAGGVSNIFLDDVILEGSLLIPWLTESPTTGSLAASGGAQVVQAIFDATGLTAGTYNGTLRVESNTLYSPQDMPVSLTVGAEFISQQTGNWSGTAWASGTPSANDWVTVTTGHTVTVDSATAACYGLTIMPGGILVIPAGNTLTVESEVQNNGTLRQTKSIPGTGDVDFHLRAGGGAVSYYGLLFEAGYNMGNTTVDIHGAVINGTGTLNQTAARWFDITPQNALTGIPTTFYYTDDELNDNVADTLNVYHYGGSGQWDVMTTLARGGSGAARYITAQIGPDFSPFVLKSPDAPTAVRTNGISAVSGGVLAFGVGLFALGGAAAVFRRRRRL